ncbi:MAG: exported protein of unknown function [Promethearchaeota archaeon]|jgi:hypothetical protein|nr:MAG: exported protein of unknown function [Candidatus Lokiarchaeota archaeon]
MKRTIKIALIVLVCVCGVMPTGMIAPVAAQSQDSGLGFEFSSDIVTKTFSMYKEYNNETFSYKYNGVSFHEFTWIYNTYWGEDGYFHVIEITDESEIIQFNHEYNTTVSGYFRTEMTLDMYEVKITFGDSYEMRFYALKNGSFFTEYYQDYRGNSIYRFDIIYTTYTTVEKIYLNENMETLLSEEIIDVEEDVGWGGTPDEDIRVRDDFRVFYYNQTASFAAPLVMINQMFITPNGQKVAWGEFMWEMIAFNDNNNDGYYSADTNFYDDPEFEEKILPYILDSYVYYDTPGDEPIREIDQSFPNDMSVADASSLINFKKPTLSNGTLSWGVDYTHFPLIANGTFALILPEISYADSLKADYSFDFEFFLNEDDTQLDITSGFTLTNSSQTEFAMLMDGMSLCVPQYSYLLSSMKIDQQFSDAITRKQEVFEFEGEKGIVCEIDMSGLKEPYTLYNHSDENKALIYDCVGAGVSKIITTPMQGAITPATTDYTHSFEHMTFLPNLVFSVGDLVQDDPLLRESSNASRLLSIETKNYPIWSGNSFYHDPSLKVDLAPQLPLLEIGIVLICGVIGISAVALLYRKFKK